MAAWILVCVSGLLVLFGTPLSAFDVSLTSDLKFNDVCNGSEVIFTCETRGSGTLQWRCNSFYVRNQIGFAAELHSINTTRLSSSNADTVATLTQNYMDGGVPVLVSTLRIIALLDEANASVICAHNNGINESIGFQVLTPPAVPQGVVTFQLEHVQNMCAITSVLQSPINPAEANATNYTVSVDGSSVPYMYSIMESAATSGIKHSILVYNSSCGAHSISISANSMCGASARAYEIMLDPEQRFTLNVPSFGGARNIKCSVTAVIGGVVLIAFKYLLDLP